ncbi:MAG: hypothetical protein BWK80_13995 [Desulfobacteraceae bacterium IS3]|nr:MAG: hypothetical protein BWK80_13995 [Desulfobacteraceae bacterium IS3]HAO20837.1 hypothetical protein [Desulfobacteraceae bacterium]
MSEVIAAEIEYAPVQVQKLYDVLLNLNPEIVSVNNEMTDPADAYQKHNILTPKYYDDGLHIAIATVTEADMLVSRNFRHIVAG